MSMTAHALFRDVQIPARLISTQQPRSMMAHAQIADALIADALLAAAWTMLQRLSIQRLHHTTSPHARTTSPSLDAWIRLHLISTLLRLSACHVLSMDALLKLGH
jgi:hypothetical protein